MDTLCSDCSYSGYHLRFPLGMLTGRSNIPWQFVARLNLKAYLWHQSPDLKNEPPRFSESLLGVPAPRITLAYRSSGKKASLQGVPLFREGSLLVDWWNNPLKRPFYTSIKVSFIQPKVARLNTRHLVEVWISHNESFLNISVFWILHGTYLDWRNSGLFSWKSDLIGFFIC